MKITSFITALLFLFLVSCNSDNKENNSYNYREMMRSFVQDISSYIRSKDEDFIILVQNGIELFTEDGTPKTPVRYDYLDAFDGVSQEGLFFGYDEFNKKTDDKITQQLISLLKIAKENNKPVLITDYCKGTDKIKYSYNKNKKLGFISFQADSLDLDKIPDYPPEPWDKNPDNITKIDYAKNYLYLLDFHKFSSKEELFDTLKATDYDILIIDAFWDTFEIFTKQEIDSLKSKQNGGKRPVIAYLSIGEAENNRYYWKDEWNYKLPGWIKDYQEWEGNFPVEFWEDIWQEIVYDYIDKIISAGFDGVFLDKVDIFEFFEELSEK